MKRIVFTIASMFIMAVAANAQTADVTKADKAAEKEAKAKAKEKQNKEMEDAMSQAGFSSGEAAKFLEITKEYNSKSTEIKKSTTLSEDEKTTQLKANTDEKNSKLKALVGEDKYKAFNKVRKEQKTAGAPNAGQ